MPTPTKANVPNSFFISSPLCWFVICETSNILSARNRFYHWPSRGNVCIDLLIAFHGALSFRYLRGVDASLLSPRRAKLTYFRFTRFKMDLPIRLRFELPNPDSPGVWSSSRIFHLGFWKRSGSVTPIFLASFGNLSPH